MTAYVFHKAAAEEGKKRRKGDRQGRSASQYHLIWVGTETIPVFIVNVALIEVRCALEGVVTPVEFTQIKVDVRVVVSD